MSPSKLLFLVGDRVKPKPEHPTNHRGNPIPRGVVTRVVPFGKGSMLQVGTRAWFESGYFDRDGENQNQFSPPPEQEK